MKRIVLTGPESSGKTTLAEVMAQQFGWPLLKEQARIYLQLKGLNYSEKDIYNISNIHILKDLEIAKQKPVGCILDTDLLNLIVWLDDKFQSVSENLILQWNTTPVVFYVLCKPDFPWVPDPMREDEARREEIFHKHKSWLIQYNKPYLEVYGSLENRMELILNALENNL